MEGIESYISIPPDSIKGALKATRYINNNLFVLNCFKHWLSLSEYYFSFNSVSPDKELIYLHKLTSADEEICNNEILKIYNLLTRIGFAVPDIHQWLLTRKTFVFNKTRTKLRRNQSNRNQYEQMLKEFFVEHRDLGHFDLYSKSIDHISSVYGI